MEDRSVCWRPQVCRSCVKTLRYDEGAGPAAGRRRKPGGLSPVRRRETACGVWSYFAPSQDPGLALERNTGIAWRFMTPVNCPAATLHQLWAPDRADRWPDQGAAQLRQELQGLLAGWAEPSGQGKRSLICPNFRCERHAPDFLRSKRLQQQLFRPMATYPDQRAANRHRPGVLPSACRPG